MKIIQEKNVISVTDDNETINIINYSFLDNVDFGDIFSIVLSKDGLIIHTCEKFNAYIGSNTVNKKISEVFIESYEEIRKMMLESIFTNKQVSNDVIVRNRTYRVLMSPISDSKMNIKYLLLNSCDISKLKKIEDEVENLKIKLEESNSVKSIFLSNISHELRTPMNAIIGFSEILLQDDQNREHLEKFLKSINYNAKYLDELLNNILDYAKIESSDFDILYENFSINELFDELADICQDANYKKNLEFVKLEFIKNDDRKIITDYLRLKQVLFNIITNSIKFTDCGYIKISYIVANDFITFKIEDSGIGIQKDKIDFVFDRFWQCDSSSTKKYKGTGLGLSISKSIVELLNGDIWLESELNKGTTFYIKIPLEEIKQDILIESKDKIDFSGKMVLIVDELPINYSLLGIYLNSLNINIVTAFSGEEAIKIYKKQKNKIKLVILDLNLPDMDSFKLSEILKSISDCKIISKTIARERSEFIDYYLKKPINKDELLSILNNVWQK